MNRNDKSGTAKGHLPTAQQLKVVADLIKDIKFGSVTLIVQDGKIVQIEKNEKMRLV